MKQTFSKAHTPLSIHTVIEADPLLRPLGENVHIWFNESKTLEECVFKGDQNSSRPTIERSFHVQVPLRTSISIHVRSHNIVSIPVCDIIRIVGHDTED